MPARELGYRAGQVLRRGLRRLQARADAASPALLPPHATHEVAFFDVRLPFSERDPIDWARDYKSGTRAPRLFYGDLDYRDEQQVGDSKYTWELNRHQFLASWAWAFRSDGDPAHAQAVVALILDWIAKNPRYLGINWCSSLELALRILAWGIALDLCAGADVASAARASIASSVQQQAEYIRDTLSEHSSANNHLLGELIGLLAAAAFFPDAEGALEHARFAGRRLVREALLQTFADGVSREQAIYYHHYVAEYVLTGMTLMRRLGQDVPEAVSERARRMLEFTDAVTDDAGRTFEIGDTDEGTVTGLNRGTGAGPFESLLWSGFLVYGDDAFGAHAERIARAGGRSGPDRRSLYWHGAEARPLPEPNRRVARRAFVQGGYLVSQDDDSRLLFKAGPFGYPSIAAHAHCDQLSVCLERQGRTVLTDSGTGVYHTQERWRRFFKGTTAHNTVAVDGRDQAEYGGPFLWTSHADGRLQLLVDEADRFEASGSHDGYRRLSDPVDHHRSVAYRRGIGYLVTDSLSGRSAHDYELFWNFGRAVSVGQRPGARSDEFLVAACLGAQTVLMLLVQGDPGMRAELRFGDESVPAGFESRAYLERQPVAQLHLRLRAPSCVFRSYLLSPAPELIDERRADIERWR
jgi:hypothetical protein